MTLNIPHAPNPVPADRDFIARIFLQKLAAATASGQVALTEWEEKFVNDSCGKTKYTQGQRFVIDNLFKKYSVQLPLAKSIRVHPCPSVVKKVSPERAGELFAAAKKEAGL
jgi:hypothetical protein